MLDKKNVDAVYMASGAEFKNKWASQRDLWLAHSFRLEL
jgi:hypothetical protein